MLIVLGYNIKPEKAFVSASRKIYYSFPILVRFYIVIKIDNAVCLKNERSNQYSNSAHVIAFN